MAWLIENLLEVGIWFIAWQLLAFLYEHFLKFLIVKLKKEHDEDT